MMVAAGRLLVITRSTESTVRVLGAMPKLRIRTSPLQTCCGIESITPLEGWLARQGWSDLPDGPELMNAIKEHFVGLRQRYIHLGLCLGTIAILPNEPVVPRH